MRRAAVLLFLLSCKVRNDGYCDDQNPCPAGFMCNLTRTCEVVPPTPCDGGPGICPAEEPFCRAGVCDRCQVDLECPAGAPKCGGDGTCTPCESNDPCMGRTGAGLCVGGACVECGNNDDCVEENRRFCGSDHSCRGCQADDECGSGLCDTEQGGCVDAGDILYVAMNGSGTTCSMALPCRLVSDALAAVDGSRNWIQVGAGTYPDDVVITTGEVHVVGAGETTRLTPLGTGPVVWVQEGASLLVRAVRLQGGSEVTSDGIRCEGATGNRATVRAFNVTIETNRGAGINGTNCVLTLVRSLVRGNQNGGILLSQSPFTIVNNFITGNGFPGPSDAGGLRIQMFSEATPVRFDFNTVAVNRAPTTPLPVAGGVQCGQLMEIDMSSNIIWENEGNGQVAGNCTHAYSDIMGGAPGTTNINADPAFLSAGDFHVRDTSPCKGMGNPGLLPAVDIDGQVRPSPPTIGADEP